MRIFTNLHAMVFAAILVAISVTGKLFAINLGEMLRISYENLPIAMAGIIFGPFAGFVVGICADICGCLAVAYTINPIITLGAGAIGLVCGTISLFAKNRFSPVWLIVSDVAGHIVGSIIIKTIGIAIYYGAENGFWALMFTRVATYIPVVIFEIIIFVFLLTNKHINRELIKLTQRKIKRTRKNKMTYTEALEYIHSVSWKGSRPGLERITELCKKLGDPQKNMKFVHVTGTNGKGSTCAMTEIILRKSGYKTGLFTSPYVRFFNERMAVNGKSISDDQLAEITAFVKPYADSMEDKPTEFELITAIAFEYFRREKCDVVVLEVGMGGRLDSTNIIENPLVSVITGISLDHTAFLGDTEEKIAAEKAGIIKKGCPVVYGGRDFGVTDTKETGEKTAFSVIKEKADELGCAFSFCDYGALNLKKCDLDGAVFDYKDRKDVKISLLGLYQPQNAVKALEVIDALRSSGLIIPEEAVREGLAEVKWSARFEKLSEKPLVLYDGSHNPEGIAEAQRTLKYYFGDRKVNILTGVMADKDYSEMAEKLAPLANKIFTVTPDNPRSLKAEELAKVYEGFGVTSKPFDTVENGYRAAFEDSKNSGIPLVCLGSLYMYAEVAAAADLLSLKMKV